MSLPIDDREGRGPCHKQLPSWQLVGGPNKVGKTDKERTGVVAGVYFIAMEAEYSDRLLATARSAVNDANDPQAVLHAAYDAIVRGNFEAFGETVTEDVELNICGFGALDGAWRGRSEVVEATRRNFALIGIQQPEIEGMIRQGDSVAVLMRERGTFKATGQAYSIRAIQWFTFASGKIRKIDEIVASIWKA
jgi:ketosteroid isomerase-like protein